MKAVLGGKFIILIATIKKFETSHTNNFKVYQKSLKKKKIGEEEGDWEQGEGEGEEEETTSMRSRCRK